MSAGRKHVFFHHPSKVSFGPPTTKDRWKSEKHAKLSNISFMWLGCLHRKWRPREATQPQGCDSGCDEEWKVTGMWQDRKAHGGTCGACFWELSVPSVFGDRRLLYSTDREDNSLMRPLWRASGEGQKLLPTWCFTNSFIWEYSIHQGAVFWGSTSWVLSL